MPRGGKREGAGRPRKFSERGSRIDVYLPEYQINFLKTEGNMSQKIQNYINQEMLDRAHTRIDDFCFSAEDQEFIFADWTEGNEHLEWLFTASREEIADWIEAGK